MRAVWHEGGGWARGIVFFFGGCSGVGGEWEREHGGFNPARGDHGSGHAAPCHLRRDGTRGVGFCFFLGGCSGVGGEWEREHEGGLIRCAGRPREWSCGAVPPQERWHEGGWFLFFLWRLLRCRRGILSHARERPATHAAAGAAARGVLVFGLGDYFAVGLGAVAGAWVDHRSGQTRMPPQSDGTRGFWF